MNQVVTKLVISLMLALNCNNYLVDPKFNTTQIADLETDVYETNQVQEVEINQVLGFQFKNELCSVDNERYGGYTYFDYNPNVLDKDNEYRSIRIRRKIKRLLAVKVMADRKCSAIRQDFGEKLKEKKRPNIYKLFICNLCGDDDNSDQCKQRLGLYNNLGSPAVEFNLTNADPSEMIKLIDDRSIGGIRWDRLRSLFVDDEQTNIEQLPVEDFCPRVCVPSDSLLFWFLPGLIVMVCAGIGLVYYIWSFWMASEEPKINCN